jgi:hypothetical protein
MAPRLTLATEILALRQQLTVLNRSIKRPQLDRRDQFFRAMLSRLRKNWLEGHFNGAGRPAGEWTARQIIEAFTDNEAPRYLSRDCDGVYGEFFRNRVQGMGIEEAPTARRSPSQNPYAERVIGGIRRECLDHLIVINEDHLRRILREYFDYYHNSRPHQPLSVSAGRIMSMIAAGACGDSIRIA